MKKRYILALLCVAYYAHARYVFSESHLQSWVAQHALNSFAGDPKSCDDFASDLKASLGSLNRQNQEIQEVGKDEVCQLQEQGAAAFKLMQARLSTTYEDFAVERSGFPWLSSKVSYTEKSSINGPHIPAMNATATETLMIQRTLSGLKIKSMESNGTVEF